MTFILFFFFWHMQLQKLCTHTCISSDYCVYYGVFVFEWPKVKDINKIDSSESSIRNIFLGIGID